MAERVERASLTSGTGSASRGHAVFDKPLLTLVLSIICFFVASTILTVLFTLLFQLLGIDSPLATLIIENAPAIIVSVTMLLAYQCHFAAKFDGMFHWSWTGLALMLPGLAFAGVNLMKLTEAAEPNPLLPVLAMALAPGISEEIVFRAIPASNWMRTHGEERDVVPCVLVTALAFSLVHAANLFAGAALFSTVFQVAYAFALGVFFCAVMLRSGSLWPTAIAHTVIDATAMLFMDMGEPGLLTEELTLDPMIIIPVIATIAVCAIGIYLVRPSKRADIVLLWDEKWGRA